MDENNRQSNSYVENHCINFLEKIILFQLQLFGRQLFIWIGERPCTLDNLCLGLPSNDEDDQTGCATCLAGDIDSPGADLAAKLGECVHRLASHR